MILKNAHVLCNYCLKKESGKGALQIFGRYKGRLFKEGGYLSGGAYSRLSFILRYSTKNNQLHEKYYIPIYNILFQSKRKWNRTNPATGLVNRMLHAKRFKICFLKNSLYMYVALQPLSRIEISWKRVVFLKMKTDPRSQNIFSTLIFESRFRNVIDNITEWLDILLCTIWYGMESFKMA